MAKKKYLRFGEITVFEPRAIDGVSLTVPGLAPSLLTLISSAVDGEPLRRNSGAFFDEDDNTGFARAQVSALSMEEVSDYVSSRKSDRSGDVSEDGHKDVSRDEQVLSSEASSSEPQSK